MAKIAVAYYIDWILIHFSVYDREKDILLTSAASAIRFAAIVLFGYPQHPFDMVSQTYLVKRIFQVFLTVYVVMTLSFALTRLVPGGPEDVIRGQLMKQYGNSLTQREINQRVQLYVNYQVDAPIWEQYLNYVISLVQGDLGRSIRYSEPVATIIVEALPWTLLIMFTAIIITFLMNVSIGAIMAYKEGSRLDVSLTIVSLFITSIPFYVVAVLAVYLLGFIYGIFPVQGHYSSNVEPGWNLAFVKSVAYHSVLPIASMVVTGIGAGALSMRGNAISVLGEDFLRVGRLRGLSDRRLIGWHLLPNAVLPMYTGLMISIGFMFSGAVILEEIFAYPGIGYFMIRAINARDYPLMMGIFLLISTAVAVALLLADLTYGMIDPRIETGNESAETYHSGEGLLSVATLRRIKNAVRRFTRQSGADHEQHEFDEVNVDSTFEQTVSHEQASLKQRLYTQADIWMLTPARVIWSDLRARVGVFIILVFVFMGVVGVYLVEPTTMGQNERLVPAFTDPANPLGTDLFGRDLLSLLIHATPDMLKMIFAGAVFATTVGTIVGTVSGYVGGRLDRMLTTFSDIAMTIPGLPLVIVLAAIINPENPYLVGLLLTINAWAGLARTIRTQVLAYRDEAYVEASRLMNVSTKDIVLKDITPNIMPYVLVNFMQSARGVIFGSVGLYFIGVLPYASANWGVMMNEAYNKGGALYTLKTVHWFLVPMFAVVLFSFGLILLAQGMDRLFNPRIRARHAKTVPEEDTPDEDDQTGGDSMLLQGD